MRLNQLLGSRSDRYPQALLTLHRQCLLFCVTSFRWPKAVLRRLMSSCSTSLLNRLLHRSMATSVEETWFRVKPMVRCGRQSRRCSHRFANRYGSIGLIAGRSHSLLPLLNYHRWYRQHFINTWHDRVAMLRRFATRCQSEPSSTLSRETLRTSA